MDNMKYNYSFCAHLSSGGVESADVSIDCQAYAYSLPDNFGCMAHCWFPKGTAISAAESDISVIPGSLYPVSVDLETQHVVEYRYPDGVWVTLNTKHLTPR